MYNDSGEKKLKSFDIFIFFPFHENLIALHLFSRKFRFGAEYWEIKSNENKEFVNLILI